MSSLALINEFLGQPPNASSHGYQIDHILEFCHWFMGALFVGWSAFFIFVFDSLPETAASWLLITTGVKSGISTHLEFSVVLIEAVLLLGFAIPLWAKRVNQFPPGKDATLVHVVAQQFSFNYHLPGPDGQFGRRDISFESNSNPLGLDPNDPAGKDDIVTTWRTSCSGESPSHHRTFLKGCDPRFLFAKHADRWRRNSRFAHPDVVHSDQDRDLRSDLRPAVRSGPLLNERDARGRYTAGLRSVAERTRRVGWRRAKRTSAWCAEDCRTTSRSTGKTNRAAPAPSPSPSG